MIVFWIKAIAVWMISLANGILAVHFAAETGSAGDISAVVTGPAGVTGLVFLIWKLVTDHSVTKDQQDRYRDLLDVQRTELADKDAENDRLKVENERLRFQIIKMGHTPKA